ncbi:MAG: hypothetical protein ACREV5_22065 [Steroidobacter sp.]
MSQHSEDRLEQSAPGPADPQSARILPFERPPSDLQRAVQLRAQETMELERERDREANKPAPLRWLVVMAIAVIPVYLLFSAVDAFVRVIQTISQNYSTMPAATPAEPVQPQPDLTSSEPGVILLQPYVTQPPAQGDQAVGSESEEAGKTTIGSD